MIMSAPISDTRASCTAQLGKEVVFSAAWVSLMSSRICCAVLFGFCLLRDVKSGSGIESHVSSSVRWMSPFRTVADVLSPVANGVCVTDDKSNFTRWDSNTGGGVVIFWLALSAVGYCFALSDRPVQVPSGRFSGCSGGGSASA